MLSHARGSSPVSPLRLPGMAGPRAHEHEAPRLIEAKPEPGTATDLMLTDADVLAPKCDPPRAIEVGGVGRQLVVGALTGSGVAGAEVPPGTLGSAVLGHDGPACAGRIVFEGTSWSVRRQVRDRYDGSLRMGSGLDRALRPPDPPAYVPSAAGRLSSTTASQFTWCDSGAPASAYSAVDFQAWRALCRGSALSVSIDSLAAAATSVANARR
jgi:hypothetical protein